MGKFTTTENHSIALDEVELPNTETRRLHLVNVKSRVAADIYLESGNNIEAQIKTIPFDGRYMGC